MTDVSQFRDSLLKSLLDQSPIIIPCLVFYLAGSPASLRYWLAAEATPALVITKEGAEKLKPKRDRKTILITIAMWLAQFAAYFMAFFSAFRLMGRPAAVIDAVYTSLFFPLAVSVTAGLFCRSAGFDRSVHRTLAGLPFVMLAERSAHRSKSMAPIMVSLANGISIAAFVADIPVAGAIVFTAFLSIFHASLHAGAMSIRRIMLVLFVYMAAIAFVVAALAYISTINSSESRKQPADVPSNLDTLTAEIRHWGYWMASMWWSSVPALLMSICLRFDYANHAAATSEAEPITLEAVSAPTSKPELGRGVLIPARLPVKFAKPYYITALASWLVSTAVLLATLAYFDASTGPEYGTLQAVAALPVMCLAIIGMSVLKGDTRAMWKYQEEWVVKPVILDSLTADGDEKEVPLINMEGDTAQSA